MTVVSVFGGLKVMTASLDSETEGENGVQSLVEAQNFFRITNHHLFNPLLYLVANVISELKTHEDMLSP